MGKFKVLSIQSTPHAHVFGFLGGFGPSRDDKLFEFMKALSCCLKRVTVA
jgi:hypothetical protein